MAGLGSVAMMQPRGPTENLLIKGCLKSVFGRDATFCTMWVLNRGTPANTAYRATDGDILYTSSEGISSCIQRWPQMLKTATALVIWILALVACGASATSVPPGNTPNIDATAAAASQAMTQAMAAPTVVPTPLPTAVPTIPAPTSTPTPTETLAPTPTPAPSGRIVFESHRDGRNNYEIYVMNPDGSGVTRLTNDSVNDTEQTRGSTHAGRPVFFDSEVAREVGWIALQKGSDLPPIFVPVVKLVPQALEQIQQSTRPEVQV